MNLHLEQREVRALAIGMARLKGHHVDRRQLLNVLQSEEVYDYDAL